jgi:hypothetical protein
VRLVSLATHHFLLDVLTDARQIHRLRAPTSEKGTKAAAAASSSSSDAHAQVELQLADLSTALHQHGIQIAKPEYVADSVFSGGLLNPQQAVLTPQSNLSFKDEQKSSKPKKARPAAAAAEKANG